jgi:hypothetical protein
MSRQQRIAIFHFPIVPVVVLLMVANLTLRTYAQEPQPSDQRIENQNKGSENPAQPSGSPSQTANDPSPAPAKEQTPAPSLSVDGIPATVVDGDQVQGILGKQVRSSTGEDMGRIVDVIVDRSARVRAAVIDFGGFLGVGNRQIAVAWNAIRFAGQGKPDMLVLDFTRDQLRVAPAYKAGEQIVLLGSPINPNSPSAGGTPDKAPPPKDSPPK